MTSTQERAILAGGCFWGLQDLFRRQAGVISTRVGHSGGEVPHATYRNHGNHAEAIEIIFDPEKLSYRKLLEYFFQIHDPTTLNRQGNDIGSQYRSAVYVHDAAQRAEAEKMIAGLGEMKIWRDPIVTEVTPAQAFYPAEEYHQHFYANHPEQGYCQAVIAPKVAKLRGYFTRLVKQA